MSSFFYMLTYQVELDDYVFFTSVELLNKFVFCLSRQEKKSFFVVL